jgi:hypothetical protein
MVWECGGCGMADIEYAIFSVFWLKMKSENYHNVETFPKSNEEIVETEKI